MIELPKEKIKKIEVEPRRLLLYSVPKAGKTTIFSQLPNSLIIDTEDGSDFVDALKIKIDTTLPFDKQYEQFMEILRAIWKEGYNRETGIYTPPYETLIVDTMTRLDEWSEIIGTLEYMDKPQGKSYNRDEKDRKTKLSPSDPRFEKVTALPQGYGYMHTRDVMMRLYDNICRLSPKTIFCCHVKDKYVAQNLSEEVYTREIALTGKVKDIYASKVDAIAYAFREGNVMKLSFSGTEGSRCPHLSGKTIVISESSEDGSEVNVYWDRIYPSLKK